jgi:RND family efflux transporter MFP subunit
MIGTGRYSRAEQARQAVTAMTACVGALVLSAVSAAQTLEGFVEPYQEIEIAAPEPGVVDVLDVKEGQKVQAGQVLALLDNRLLQAALAVAEARKASTGGTDAARADWKRKKALVERLEALQASGSARAEEVEAARADYEIASAQLKSARERKHISELEYARIQAQIEHRTLRSRIDGVVTEVYKDPGELVTMAAPRVLRISRLDKLRIVAHVVTSTVDLVSVGSAVPVKLPESGLEVTAHVEYVAPVADPKSGTVVVWFVLDNESNRIRSGQRAAVQIQDYALGSR